MINKFKQYPYLLTIVFALLVFFGWIWFAAPLVTYWWL